MELCCNKIWPIMREKSILKALMEKKNIQCMIIIKQYKKDVCIIQENLHELTHLSGSLMLWRADEKVLLLLDCLGSCLDGMTVLFCGMLSSPKRNAFTVLITNHFCTWQKEICQKNKRIQFINRILSWTKILMSMIHWRKRGMLMMHKIWEPHSSDYK